MRLNARLVLSLLAITLGTLALAGPAEAQQDEIVRTVERSTELGRNDQALTDSNL